MYNKTDKRNIFRNNQYVDFYHKIYNNLNIETSQISCLYLNDKIISLHLGFYEKNTFFYLMPSYDLSFSKYSPGKILLHHLFDYCRKNNYKYFDFTVGNEDYKKIWANQTLKMLTFKKIFNLKGIFIHIFLESLSALRSNKIIYKFYSIFRNNI